MGNTSSSKQGRKGAGHSKQGSAAFGPFSPDEFAQLHDLFKCVKMMYYSEKKSNAHVALQCRYSRQKFLWSGYSEWDGHAMQVPHSAMCTLSRSTDILLWCACEKSFRGTKLLLVTCSFGFRRQSRLSQKSMSCSLAVFAAGSNWPHLTITAAVIVVCHRPSPP